MLLDEHLLIQRIRQPRVFAFIILEVEMRWGTWELFWKIQTEQNFCSITDSHQPLPLAIRQKPLPFTMLSLRILILTISAWLRGCALIIALDCTEQLLPPNSQK